MINAEKAKMNSDLHKYGLDSLAGLKERLSRLSLRKYRMLYKETKRCGALIKQASQQGDTHLRYTVVLEGVERRSYVHHYDEYYDTDYDDDINQEYRELCGELVESLKRRGYKVVDISYQYDTEVVTVLMIEW